MDGCEESTKAVSSPTTSLRSDTVSRRLCDNATLTRIVDVPLEHLRSLLLEYFHSELGRATRSWVVLIDTVKYDHSEVPHERAQAFKRT